MPTKPCIIFAAGGTGGHIVPALAVAEVIQRQSSEYEIRFLGVGREIEKTLISQAGFALDILPSVPIVGVGVLGYWRFFFRVPSLTLRMFRIYRVYRPQVAVGFGGYPSFLPVIMGWLMRVPCIIHEQNVQVGLANKVLSLVARKIFAVNGACDFWLKTKVQSLPNPVRAVFLGVPAWKMFEPNEPMCLAVFGGSQGAVSLNSAIVELAGVFRELGIVLVHQTGARDYERVVQAYQDKGFQPLRVAAFIDDVASVYAKSHLVICRAGAMTVAEISASGRPAIYVPLPIAGGHQVQNVKFLVQQKAAIVVEQNERLVVNLGRVLRHLVGHPEELAEMAERAKESAMASGEVSSAEVIAREVLREARGSGRINRE